MKYPFHILLLSIPTHLSLSQTIHTVPLLPHSTIESRRRHRHRNLPAKKHRTEPTPPPISQSHPSTPQQLVSLYQGYGTHYVDLWIGHPTPQRQTVIVDTGSSITAFPCVGCLDCGDGYHTDEVFNSERSDTFRKLACSECDGVGSCSGGMCALSLSYAEGSSWRAFGAMDRVYSGGRHDRAVMGGTQDEEESAANYSFDLKFGCQSSITGLFKTQLADGIMGMSNSHASLWHQMYESGTIEKRMFSLCFVRADSVETGGTRSGAMSLGGADERLWETPLVYAKSPGAGGSFNVRVRRVYVWTGMGVSASVVNMTMEESEITRLDLNSNELNSGQSIVDSGTTDTYLNYKIFGAFKAEWKRIMGMDYSNSNFALTDEEVDQLPTILLQLEGTANDDYNPDTTAGLANSLDDKYPRDVVIAIPPMHYIEYVSDEDKYVGRIYSSGRGNTFGANTMMNHDVVFDVDANRIGFAVSSCDYDTLIGGSSYEPITIDESFTLDDDENDNDHDQISYTSHAETKASANRDDDNDETEGTCSTSNCRMFVSVSFLSLVLVVLVWTLRRKRHTPVSTVDDDDDNVTSDEIYDTEIIVNTPPVV